MDYKSRIKLGGVLILLAAPFRPAFVEAKIMFTGYGNLQMTAYSGTKIYGDEPALAAFRLTGASLYSRGFNTESVGLFATTNIKEGLDFLIDFTYRRIGRTVNETSIQYAYVEGAPWEDFIYRVGKITLPFGYFNQRRFYGFQRAALSPPLFQSSILGLPIADSGAGVTKTFRASYARVDADFYASNGYGPTASDATKFRSALLPGAVTLSNNFGPTNHNENIALGGRVKLSEIAGRDMETGVSYYGGAWDRSGTRYLQMVNGHVYAVLARVDILLEYLHMDVSGDPGFAASVGDTHWKTDGYFMTASYPLWEIRQMPLSPFVGAETYITRGHNGSGGQENLQSYRSGLSLQAMENIRVKLEYQYLYYKLPLVGLGDLKLSAHSISTALSLAF